MDNQYPLCNGEYRDVIDGILSNFTIDSFIGAVTLTSTENSIAINSSFGAFGDPTPSTQGKNRVGAICRYINDTLPESERTRVITMLYHDRDFYGFMEYYLTGYDGMYRMIKRNINDYSRIHNAMQLLNDNISKRINYYYFHPAIYNTVSFMVTHMDITLPLIESVRLLQERGKLDINFQTAIEITREYHISKLPDMQRSVICDVVDSVNEEVWDNVVFDDATLDMITQIFYK